MNCATVGLLLIVCLAPCLATSPALVLTPYISKNHTQEARTLSSVDPRVFLNITSHSGFITVDEQYDSNIFFWYFPVAGKPVNETPWLVWLQGGPGATSMYGLFLEIGPFEYVHDELKLREYAWTKDYSVLFIDNPVGTGFSYTKNDKGYITNMDMCSNHLFIVLEQFLKVFTELKEAPLYLAGESYAGRYLPALGMKILAEKQRAHDITNLKGIILGNPVINRENMGVYSNTYYQWGMIDDQGVIAVRPEQEAYEAAVRNGDNTKAIEGRNKVLDTLQDMAMQGQNYNVLKDVLLTKELLKFQEYLNDAHIREAIHVGLAEFALSNSMVSDHLAPDFLSNVYPKVETLLEHYKILIYCGQLDAVAPCVPTAKARRRKWHWSGRDLFLRAPRTPWSYNETIAGYVKSGGGLTEVLVRGAGHLVPLDKPAPTLQLISYFIQGFSLPVPSNFQTLPETVPYEDIDEEIYTSAKSNGVLISSVIINVLLLVVVVTGAVYFIRWKKRTELMFYSDVDSVNSDHVLTLA